MILSSLWAAIFNSIITFVSVCFEAPSLSPFLPASVIKGFLTVGARVLTCMIWVG